MTGRRTSSRRTTPQPQAQPASSARATRATRSQSREVERLQEQAVQRTTRRGIRGASADAAGTTDNNAARPTRASRRTNKMAGEDLSIVEEDADVQYPDLPDDARGALAGTREVTPPLLSAAEYAIHRSPGDQSDVSGTTAISAALSVHDPADLDPEFMMEFLDDLHNDSAKVLEIVAPRTASVDHLHSVFLEVRKPGSRTNQVLEKRTDRFHEARQNFGADTFISRDTIIASFAGSTPLYQLDNAFRRPDAILYKANLASFAKNMVSLERERSDTFDVLLKLDHTYPRDFISSLWDGDDPDEFQPGNSTLIEETFGLALDIRTQFSISLLLAEQTNTGFDPDQMLHSVFFNQADDLDEAPEAPTLRGWEVLGLGSGDEDLPAAIKDTVFRRIQKIRQAFSKDEVRVDPDKLESLFPWSDFILRVLEWSRIRSVELDEEIQAMGGVDGIKASLREHLESSMTGSFGKRSKKTASQSQGASTEPDSQSQNIPKTAPAVINVLRKHLARVSGQGIREDGIEQAGEPHGAIAQGIVDDYHPPVVDEEEDDSRTFINSPKKSFMQEDLNRLRQLEKQNKENLRKVSGEAGGTPRKSFYDRQPGATRVSFDEAVTSPKPTAASPSKALGKRRRAQTDSDDDDDEFETHIRETTRRAPVDKRSRYTPSAAPPSSGLTAASQARRTPSAGPEPIVGSDTEDEGPVRYSAARRFNDVARQAKQRVNPTSPRKRKPWTDAEVDALHEGMRQFGHTKQPWRAIKLADDTGDQVLIDRDYVALKDKARNLVKTYKIAGQGLPEGFQHLVLGDFHQRDVDRRRGILDDE